MCSYRQLPPLQNAMKVIFRNTSALQKAYQVLYTPVDIYVYIIVVITYYHVKVTRMITFRDTVQY